MTEPNGEPINPEIVFQPIEAALVTEARKYYGEESNITLTFNLQAGSISATCNGAPLDVKEMFDRIGPQTAKQIIVQKIREAEKRSK